jgi:hypothetical protein
MERRHQFNLGSFQIAAPLLMLNASKRLLKGKEILKEDAPKGLTTAWPAFRPADISALVC